MATTGSPTTARPTGSAPTRGDDTRQMAIAAAVYSGLTGLAYRRQSAGRRALGVFFAVMGLAWKGALTATAPEQFPRPARRAPWGRYRRAGLALTEPAPRAFDAAMTAGETAVAAAILGPDPATAWACSPWPPSHWAPRRWAPTRSATRSSLRDPGTSPADPGRRRPSAIDRRGESTPRGGAGSQRRPGVTDPVPAGVPWWAARGAVRPASGGAMPRVAGNAPAAPSPWPPSSPRRSAGPSSPTG